MSAVFSPCRTWRYTLTRWLTVESHSFRTVTFVCLNPSTADEVNDDPTVRRCLGYAQRWGFERLVVCNIFALRSTDPKLLYRAEDPVGPETDFWLERHALDSELVLCAWGAHGKLHGRGAEVLDRLRTLGHRWDRPVAVLGWTLPPDRQPKHPLYLRADLQPIPLEAAAA